jgi:hypothetical protein
VTQPFNFRRSALALALTLAALLGAAGSSAKASAQIDPLIDPIFQIDPGMRYAALFSNVGVARGQVARLSVVYDELFPPGPCDEGSACVPPATFRAKLTINECDGSVAVERAVSLSPGRPATVIYSPTTFGPGGRACARGTVTVDADPSGYAPRLVPTVEVFDPATGQTFFVNPGSLAGFNPQPEPPGDSHFGFFNVVKGQTARVNISYLPPGPCRADLPPGPCRTDLPPGPCRVLVTFYDGDGRIVGQDARSVEAGKTALLDFSTSGLSDGWRGRVRASVHAESSDGRTVPPLATSVEVFNNDTGRTSFFYTGALIGLL